MSKKKFNWENSPVRENAEQMIEKKGNVVAKEQNAQTDVTMTKAVQTRIPYDLYDKLDALKRRSERTGKKSDKMGISELLQVAIQEYVDRNY